MAALNNTAFSVKSTHVDGTNVSEVFKYDHTTILFKGGVARGEIFEYASAFVFDIDNSHSEDPADWIHPKEIGNQLEEIGLNYVMTASRHHLIPKKKNGVIHEARPKFHVYLPFSKLLRDADKFVLFCEWAIRTFNSDPNVKLTSQKIFGYGDNPNAFHELYDGGQYVDEVVGDDDLAAVQKAPMTRPVSSTGKGSGSFDEFVSSGKWQNHLHDLEKLGWGFIPKDDGKVYFQTPNGDHSPGMQDGNIADGVAYFFSMAPAPFENGKAYPIGKFFAGALFGDTSKKGVDRVKEKYLRNNGGVLHDEPTFDIIAENESTGVPLLDDFCTKLQRYEFRYEEKKPNQMEHVVQTVDELIHVAKAAELDLARKDDGNYYCFNGRFWERIAPVSFYAFLRNAAMQFGVPRDLARYFLFQEKVRKQIRDIANFPFATTDEVIRINLQGGTLEFRDGHEPELVAFDKRHGLCYQLGYNYNPDADCPVYQKFLERCVPDEANQKILEEYVGYVFVRKLRFEQVLFLFGEGISPIASFLGS